MSRGPVIATEVKVELINRLSATGLIHIEAASFVSPQVGTTDG